MDLKETCHAIHRAIESGPNGIDDAIQTLLSYSIASGQTARSDEERYGLSARSMLALVDALEYRQCEQWYTLDPRVLALSLDPAANRAYDLLSQKRKRAEK